MTRCMQITLTTRRSGNPDDLSDEKIYLVATSIDLRTSPPAVDVCVYGPKDGAGTVKMESTTSSSWADASSDLDVVRPCSRPGFWRPNRGRAPLARAEDALFLIAPMEHLSGSSSMVCSLVLQAVGDVMQMPADIARNDRVSSLINVVNRTIDFANGGPNFCSAVELGLTSRDILLINSKGHLTLNKPFVCYAGCYNIDVILWIEKHTFESANVLHEYASRQQSYEINGRHMAANRL